jgi:hypothetical protein
VWYVCKYDCQNPFANDKRGLFKGGAYRCRLAPVGNTSVTGIKGQIGIYQVVCGCGRFMEGNYAGM